MLNEAVGYSQLQVRQRGATASQHLSDSVPRASGDGVFLDRDERAVPRPNPFKILSARRAWQRRVRAPTFSEIDMLLSFKTTSRSVGKEPA